MRQSAKRRASDMRGDVGGHRIALDPEGIQSAWLPQPQSCWLGAPAYRRRNREIIERVLVERTLQGMGVSAERAREIVSRFANHAVHFGGFEPYTKTGREGNRGWILRQLHRTPLE
jgi:hypothetical protein